MTMVTGIPAGKGAGSVTEGSSRALWLQQARSYLRNADPVLARLIDDRPAFDPRAWMAQLPPMDLYGALLFQVTGQQLSVAATRRILGRVEALFAAELLNLAGPHPQHRSGAARVPHEVDRVAAVSGAHQREHVALGALRAGQVRLGPVLAKVAEAQRIDASAGLAQASFGDRKLSETDHGRV